MLILLLYIFTIFTMQYPCNLCKHNVLVFINCIMLLTYLFIRSYKYICVSEVVVSMYNVWLYYIHCFCVMSCLVKPECWVTIKYVYGYKGSLLDNLLHLPLYMFLLSCFYLLLYVWLIDFVHMYIYYYIFYYLFFYLFMFSFFILSFLFDF